MTRPIPPWLSALPADLDLSNARTQPTGLARTVFVTLLAHAKRGIAWPGTPRLAKLNHATESSTRRALRLLEHRQAITREGRVWRIRLSGESAIVGPGAGCRVFWPGDGPSAFQALFPALRNRNQVAAVMMLYQFARPPQNSDQPGYPPNQTWIAGVLGTSVNTIRRAKREIVTRGLASEHEGGRLEFADPVSWSAILGAAVHDWPVVLGPCEAANQADYTDPIAAVERELALASWALPADPLALEIITTALERWGLPETLARLRAELAGPDPPHALEPIGAALGEQFECPCQLIRLDPDIP